MRKATEAAVRARSARRLRDALLLVLVAAIVGFWVYFHAAAPGTALRAWNADPEAAYFVSSLAVFAGQPYVYLDHPGTPVSMAGTALLALTWPFLHSSPEGFVARHVREPGIFMVLAHALLLAGNVACLCALGRRALSGRHWTDALMAAAVPASFFAFLPHALFWTFYWSHNAAAFPIGSVLLLALLDALRRGRPPSRATSWALGLGAGVLAATQLYFATWTLGLAAAAAALAFTTPVGARRAWTAAATMAVASLAGFALSAIPMFPRRHAFADFVAALLTRQGRYGTGPAGFSSWPAWTANVGSLVREAPALFAAFALVFALLLAHLASGAPRPREAGWRAVAAGLVVQWAATLLLLGKHPSPFYLPALAAMLPPLLAIVFVFWRRRGTAGRVACAAVATFALAGFARATVSAVGELEARMAFRAAMDAEVARRLQAASAARGNVLLLWGPGLPDARCYALWMGIHYSNGALRSEVSRACPAEGLAWSGAVVMPDGWPVTGEVPALVVTTDAILARIPALDLGAVEISAVRDPSGARLAFQSATVVDGRARAASR